MSKLETKQLTDILAKVGNILRTYSVFIFIILSLGIFGFLVFNIRTLANKEPSDDAITEKMGAQKPISIDKSAVERIQQLQQQSVDVRTLLNQNRNNPFQE